MKRAGGWAIVGVVAVSALVALYLERKVSLEIADPLQKIEAHLAVGRRPKWLAELRAACRDRDCACAKKAAAIGLDAEASDVVLGLVGAAKKCAPGEFDGIVAEALVRKVDSAKGLEQASKVLARSAEDPHALYARALSSYRARAFAPAMALAEASERAGRGWSATLLVGLIAYEAGDFERSKRAFRELLRLDPSDVDAVFNLGVAAQKEGRYGEARSSYLRVTRLRPGHADARHNLALLAHSAGALDEAKHHFEQFQRVSPRDPRSERLRAMLATPPPHGPALSPAAASEVPPGPSARAR